MSFTALSAKNAKCSMLGKTISKFKTRTASHKKSVNNALEVQIKYLQSLKKTIQQIMDVLRKGINKNRTNK